MHSLIQQGGGVRWGGGGRVGVGGSVEVGAVTFITNFKGSSSASLLPHPSATLSAIYVWPGPPDTPGHPRSPPDPQTKPVDGGEGGRVGRG